MRRAGELYAALRRSQLLPNAWEDWRAYREQVTDYIIENSRPGTTLAVFGAGRCNDLDLARLSGHFSKIELLDADEAAMREAAERCRKEAAMREAAERRRKGAAIRIHPVDFVGISKEAYLSFENRLLAFETGGADKFSAQYARALEDALSELYKKSRLHTAGLPEKSFDYTAALGVHSQLGNVPAWLVEAAWEERSGNGGIFKEPERWKLKEHLLEQIRQESARLAVQFNELILSVTRRKAFIGCELSRAVRGQGGDNSWYAAPDSAVDGAWQAVQDIERRAGQGSLRFKNYLDIIWPFAPRQGVAYRMAVMEAEPAV